MAKSSEFENIFNDCLERLLQGESIEQCLSRYPAHGAELRPLLETSARVKKISEIQPGAEFREKAKYQFQAALRDMETKKSRTFFTWQPRWAAAVITVLAFFLIGAGTVSAASGSMPDQFLYPVKLGTENVALALTRDPMEKVELYAQLADRRVDEIARMAIENKPDKIDSTSQRLNVYLADIANLASPPQAASVFYGAVADASTTNETAVPTEPTLPFPPMPATRGSVAPFELESAGDKSVTGERAELRAALERQAADNIAQLQALLQTAPDSTRPALERALAMAEADYASAIQSLYPPLYP